MVVVVVVVVVMVVVEANEAGGQAGWMMRGRPRQRGLRWRKGAEGQESQEGTKGKRVQAGLGSDEGECVTVCIVGAPHAGEGLPSTCPVLPCLCLPCKPASRTAGRPRVRTLFIAPFLWRFFFSSFSSTYVAGRGRGEKENEKEREERALR